ncbi:hypothetical protein CPB84DRAFT_1817650 [Gymnopilus junonius]|uniref:Microbial-type PARG catalytic domain-containing protein n=1 Tax=Gymnopilus junonius TaxID=109634 RepID=A0A9P5ND74_GYMJU|nr:hypothetical protein CPB84DRAFT_1817650 [Gymnopilus junonius]
MNYANDISRGTKRAILQSIALSTVEAINNGIVDVSKTQRRTKLYPADTADLVNWRKSSGTTSYGWPSSPSRGPINVQILSMSTIEGARHLHSFDRSKKVGVLNFASATLPGGGFLDGASAQEESIARASTLYVSLTTHIARPFYALHDKDEKDPFEVDVLTSPAVNAAKVRKVFHKVPFDEVEARIQEHMKERMARILALFEKRGARNLVLGSFGTGTVARIWRDLLVAPGARFSRSFDNVVFTIPDSNTRLKFECVFNVQNPIPVQL